MVFLLSSGNVDISVILRLWKEKINVNGYFACLVSLFVECTPLYFLAVNTEWLKYYKHLFIPAALTVQVIQISQLFP